MEDARGTFELRMVRRFAYLQWKSPSRIKDGAEAALVLLERQQELLKKLKC